MGNLMMTIFEEYEVSLFFFFLILAVWSCMWDLSSLTRDEPVPPALEAQSLNHWNTREVQPHILCFKKVT